MENNTNAREELLKKMLLHKKDRSLFDFAKIEYEAESNKDSKKIATKDFDEVLSFLDFDYDAGFGTQHLFGEVVFKDNTWLERIEYDGAEYWHLQQIPKWDSK